MSNFNMRLHIEELTIFNLFKNASLNKYKTAGVDGVYPYILNKCSEELALVLNIIFKKSMNEITYPTAWRLANVTHLFKKGSRFESDNYRPVSLTSGPCKVLESFDR